MNSGRERLIDSPGLPIDQVNEALTADGVAILPGLVPADLCLALRKVIDSHVGASCDPASWYAGAPVDNGAVPIYQHQAQWNIRQLPELYALFRSLLGTPFLWVSTEGLSFKAPHRADHPDWLDNSPFHWDIDPRVPTRRLQGLVYLDDCEPEEGPFQCVPSIFRHPDSWWSVYGLEPFAEERIRPEQVHRVPGPVGSLVLWDSRLPHGCGLNLGSRPRYAMYLTMYREGDEGVRRERVKNFEESRAPAYLRGAHGQLDPEPWPAAHLSDLGEQLLGRESW